MSLEQLMDLAAQLARAPRPGGLGNGPFKSTGPGNSTVSLSADEVQALQAIWSTPLRSQMGRHAHLNHSPSVILPGSTAQH